MTPALHAHGLTRRYGDLLALAPLDLRIHEGELVALVGPNGAGKTTVLQIAAGLLEPTDGTILIQGYPPGSPAARRAVSYVPDTPMLYNDLSLREHAEFIGRLHGTDDCQPRAQTLIDQFALTDRADDLPQQFSRGMRQKTSLILGFVRPFQLLLIDEPFVGLDTVGRTQLVELIAGSSTSGAAAIVSTHQTDLLEVATRIITIEDGRLVSDHLR